MFGSPIDSSRAGLPSRRPRFGLLVTTLLLSGATLAGSAPSDAAPRAGSASIHDVRVPIPSFSRQTGLACSVCHTSFPQLTAFGRQFKLNGYTLAAGSSVGSGTEQGRPGLMLPRLSGLSAMIQFSHTTLHDAVPGTQNGNADLPEQLSFFYGGAISPKIGAFVQVTYASEDGSFGIDNADIRFATHAQLIGKETVLGVTLNNNPTVQDLWNSTPAWRYPFISSATAPGPAAAPLIDGALAQQVAGLGGYASWDYSVYGELSVYRSAPQGTPNPPNAASQLTTDGVVPYWRVSVERQWGPQTIMVGTYGLRANVFPTGIAGPTDRYTDVGFDTQYERHVGPGTLTGRGTWIRERQSLSASFAANAAANPSNTLNSYRLDADYYLDRGIGLTVGLFSLNGSRDAGLYAPGATDGSRTGKPDSRGYRAQLDFDPWQNARIGVRYVLYDRFNGAGTNYDGFGRDAAANNTLFLFGWLAF